MQQTLKFIKIYKYLNALNKKLSFVGLVPSFLFFGLVPIARMLRANYDLFHRFHAMLRLFFQTSICIKLYLLEVNFSIPLVTHTHINIHAHTPTNTQKHTHTDIHTLIHTHANTHTERERERETLIYKHTTYCKLINTLLHTHSAHIQTFFILVIFVFHGHIEVNFKWHFCLKV